MVELLNIEGYTFDKEVLRLAIEEYKKFRGSEGHDEEYKWETFEELNNWFDRNEITEDNVIEFVEFIQKQNQGSGYFVHWSELDDLREYAEKNPEELTELFDNLYHGNEDLKDRLTKFREKTGIGTPGLGYVLAAYDFEEYAPIKVDEFRYFFEDFADQMPSRITKLSIPEKYFLFYQYCNSMADFFEDEGVVEKATPLDAQDFYYTIEAYDEKRKESVFLKYLWKFSKRFNKFRSDSDRLFEEIKSLPKFFLKERRDSYEGTEKIRRIRYEVLGEWIQGEDPDIEKIKRDINADYDTNILQAWDDFKIFGQIYVDFFKDRLNGHFDNLAEYFIDQIDMEGLDYHVVNFQGIQSFVTDEPWIALYPKEKSSHTESYQLFLQIQPDRLRYGLLPGHDINPSYDRERDLEIIEPHFEDELLMDKILEKFENALPEFKRLNEIEVEEKTNYYWVNQKKEAEIELGYLEPPTDGIWQHDLEKLNKGDVVFNYFDGELIGYSEVLNDAQVVEVDEQEKYRVDVEVNEFGSPISVNEVNDYLLKDEVKSDKHYPLDKDGGVNQGYLFEFSEKAGEFLMEESSPDKTSSEILEDVFLDEENIENAREYFQQLFEYLGYVEDKEPLFSVTYNAPRKKIAVDFGHWQVLSIERKRDTYHAQFAVDKTILPEGYEKWSEYLVKVFDFEAGEDFISVRLKWSKELLDNRPRLHDAWKQALEFAKDEFRDMRATPYRRHHREGLQEWIMEGFEQKKGKKVDLELKERRKDILLEKNKADLDFDLDNKKITEGLHFPGDLEDEIIRSVLSALKSGKHIILTGPPGTGKTKLAKNVARAMQNNCDCVDDFVFTTATADWTTFDTMGGYQPSKKDGSLDFKSGQFLKCFKADGKPVNKWLIIDEINRADIDKAFGQLFSVLSEDEVELPFTDDEERTICVKPLNGEIDEDDFEYSDSDYYVTKNWRLLATMNTFDKASLYEMSYAFMRRFAFIDVGVPTEEFEKEENLISEYIWEWNVDEEEVSETHLTDLTKVWKVLNKGKRSIGPAIIKDMLMFLREFDGDGGLVNALKLYVLPQLEGMIKQNQEKIFEDLISAIGHRDELEKVARERFEIELKGDESE